MQHFPAMDPIPLPAPVWLFKLLHITVLSLHFVFVQLLLGSLLIGLAWHLRGRASQSSPMTEGSRRIARYYPTLMTYVINLGIPPLLFTQVLYGVALYTSSVLIGGYWIGVIVMLSVTYFLIYAANLRSGAGKSWWIQGTLALLLAASIGKIISTNMTLMLRPEVWVEMFRRNPHGTSLPIYDPTHLPRWLFIMAGSLTVTGLWLLALGTWQKQQDLVKPMMIRHGGLLAVVGILTQAILGREVIELQPEFVQAGLSDHALYHYSEHAWLVLAAVALLMGLIGVVAGKRLPSLVGVVTALLAVLLTAAATIVRDGIRDLSLLAQGYDVWDQKIVPNNQVLIIFLVLFVVGVAVVLWMAAVAVKAKPATGGTYQ